MASAKSVSSKERTPLPQVDLRPGGSYGDRFIYDPDFFKAWEKFGERVNTIFDRPAPPEQERRGVAEVQRKFALGCMAVKDLLEDSGEFAASKQFFQLATAFQDLVDGIPNRMFAAVPKKRKGGRHPDSTAVWRIRGRVCFALEALIASGIDDKRVRAEAVKKYGVKLSKLLRTKASLKSSLKNWQSAFADGAVRNVIALSFYQRDIEGLKVAIPKVTPDALRHYAEEILEEAASEANEVV
jgi:hypothetical protein